MCVGGVEIGFRFLRGGRRDCMDFFWRLGVIAMIVFIVFIM